MWQQPLIYEINAWTWLTHLKRKYNRNLDPGSIPIEEWDELRSASTFPRASGLCESLASAATVTEV